MKPIAVEETGIQGPVKGEGGLGKKSDPWGKRLIGVRGGWFAITLGGSGCLKKNGEELNLKNQSAPKMVNPWAAGAKKRPRQGEGPQTISQPRGIRLRGRKATAQEVSV